MLFLNLPGKKVRICPFYIQSVKGMFQALFPRVIRESWRAWSQVTVPNVHVACITTIKCEVWHYYAVPTQSIEINISFNRSMQWIALDLTSPQPNVHICGLQSYKMSWKHAKKHHILSCHLMSCGVIAVLFTSWLEGAFDFLNQLNLC